MLISRRSAILWLDVGPFRTRYEPVRVRIGPERTSNWSAAWTFKTDSTGPNTDSASDFQVQSDPLRIRWPLKSVLERWTSPLDFKIKVRVERVFDSDKVRRGLFSFVIGSPRSNDPKVSNDVSHRGKRNLFEKLDNCDTYTQKILQTTAHSWHRPYSIYSRCFSDST